MLTSKRKIQLCYIFQIHYLCNMKILIKKDSTDIFPHLYEGSVIQQAEKMGKTYKGIFTSMFGSYYVEVPVGRCKKYREDRTLYARISKWIKEKD